MSKVNDCPAIWVDDSQQFASLCRDWQALEFLAIDTEFERQTTYYPILALVQIFDGRCIYLIDPLKVECPEEFRAICRSPEIAKIMHSAREDLEVFYYSWRCEFAGLFDSQVAQAFLSGELSLGYAALVERVCQQLLDKQETRSDWLTRPLSQRQLDYAAKDVIYLPQIYAELKSQIQASDLYTWFVSECEELCSQTVRPADFDNDYRRVGEAYKLNGEQLGLFKALYRWRGQTGIDKDQTVNHIARDPQLVEIAQKQPLNISQLRQIEGLHPRSIRIHGEALLREIEHYQAEGGQPESPITNPRDVPQFKSLSDKLGAAVRNFASTRSIAPGLLASKRNLRKIAYAQLSQEAFPPIWHGWRAKVLKPLFEPIFSQYLASDPD